MDKNIEAQQIANKYLEIEISNFQIQIQSCKDAAIKNLWGELHIELDLLEECRGCADYSGIHQLLGGLLPSDHSLDAKHPMYKVLIYELFNARVKLVQEIIKMCEGPYSYDFKGGDISLTTSLTKFFARAPAMDKWKGQKQKKTQALVNELASKIRSKYPGTGVTNLAEEIAEMDKMKNSENPIEFETIRKDYLDDFRQ